MKIIPEFDRLYSGEINSRILKLCIDEDLDGKKVRLGFITPMGKIYISDELIPENGSVDYPIPSGLLDGKGMLLVQILINDEDSYVIKSAVEELPVYASVDDMSCPTVSDSTLRSLGMILDLIDKKSDIGHTHTDTYYSKDEADELLYGKSDSTHLHEGIYLTENEITRLIASINADSHEHDNRYYRKDEADEKLSLKSDASHSHNDLYNTKAETDLMLQEKSSVSHLHDDRYIKKDMEQELKSHSLVFTFSMDPSTNELSLNASQTLEELYDAIENNLDILMVAEFSDRSIKLRIRVDGLFALGYRLSAENSETHSIYIWNLTRTKLSFVYLWDFLEMLDALQTDYVVESGKTGNWNYRKWSSGRMEAWGIIPMTIEEISELGVSGLKNVSVTTKFPTGMLTSGIEQCSLCPKSWYFIGSMAGVSSNNLWGRFPCISSEAAKLSVDATRDASALLIGKWK